jgi:hypothetical protein
LKIFKLGVIFFSNYQPNSLGECSTLKTDCPKSDSFLLITLRAEFFTEMDKFSCIHIILLIALAWFHFRQDLTILRFAWMLNLNWVVKILCTTKTPSLTFCNPKYFSALHKYIDSQCWCQSIDSSQQPIVYIFT